ncbi:MAG: class I SAM-dependent methyltransferase [Armatimonadetes bacterium]|nr:class I SAM-dependent methyltransferase [Armatimonadota bacterium]
MEKSSLERQDLNEEVRRIWDRNAEWWDDRIGDGNRFQCQLIEPATERLLEIQPGSVVLDVACGAGRFGRRMAELGAHVVAIDLSRRFIERAVARTPEHLRNIEYHVVDATDASALRALGAGRFDGAVATMALMDMAAIEPLFSALPTLLKPGGWFVFSLMHPCFQTPEASRFAVSTEREGEFEVRNGVQVSQYLTPRAWKGVGILGQPEPHYYFHRPLHLLLGCGFRHGFAVDGLEEPGLPPGAEDGRYLRWDHLPEIPPILVVRMRLCARPAGDGGGATEKR